MIQQEQQQSYFKTSAQQFLLERQDQESLPSIPLKKELDHNKSSHYLENASNKQSRKSLQKQCTSEKKQSKQFPLNSQSNLKNNMYKEKLHKKENSLAITQDQNAIQISECDNLFPQFVQRRNSSGGAYMDDFKQRKKSLQLECIKNPGDNSKILNLKAKNNVDKKRAISNIGKIDALSSDQYINYNPKNQKNNLQQQLKPIRINTLNSQLQKNKLNQFQITQYNNKSYEKATFNNTFHINKEHNQSENKQSQQESFSKEKNISTSKIPLTDRSSSSQRKYSITQCHYMQNTVSSNNNKEFVERLYKNIKSIKINQQNKKPQSISLDPIQESHLLSQQTYREGQNYAGGQNRKFSYEENQNQVSSASKQQQVTVSVGKKPKILSNLEKTNQVKKQMHKQVLKNLQNQIDTLKQNNKVHSYIPLKKSCQDRQSSSSQEKEKKKKKKNKKSNKLTLKPIQNKQKSSIESQVLQAYTGVGFTRGPYFYIVESGNNSQVIKNALNIRPWWIQSDDKSFNFKWKPTSHGMIYEELIKMNKKFLVNHIQNHSEITTKSKLFYNIQRFANQKGIEVSKITPNTFVFNINTDTYLSELEQFLSYFQEQEQKESSLNVYLLKPHDMNCGRGISLFNNLEQLYDLLAEYGREDILDLKLKKLIQENNLNSPQKLNIEGGDMVSSCNNRYSMDQTEQNNQKQDSLRQTLPYKSTEIRQRYHSNLFNTQACNQNNQPLAQSVYASKPGQISKRKGVWVLIDHDLNFYMYKESYVRLSGEQFNLDPNNLNNKFIHLTNNAIQKYGENYGKEESGNIIKTSKLGEYMKSNNEPFQMSKIMEQIKELIMISIACSKRVFQRSTINQSCFELFGYDFMIDKNGVPLLIEINTNPSLDQSNEFLNHLIQRMINDLLRITIDKVFPPNKNLIENQENQNDLKQQNNNNNNNSNNNSDQQNIIGVNHFPLEGYKNEENLWEKLGSLNQRYQKLYKFKYFNIQEYI